MPDGGDGEGAATGAAASTPPAAAAPGTGPDGASSEDTFPRQYARTHRLTLGEPRTITVSPDGRRVVFVRSRGGSDPVNCLWVLDVAVADDEPVGDERLVADPLVLLAGGDDDLPRGGAGAARAGPGAGRGCRRVRHRRHGHRRRVRAVAAGCSWPACCRGWPASSPVEGPVFDPRPDPLARRLAYVRGRTLRIAELDGTSRELAGEEDPDVSWGSAEFVAAEEMGRTRGYWWAPDGAAVVGRPRRHVPGRPLVDQRSLAARPAAGEHAYPAAGTANAVVTLYVLGARRRRRRSGGTTARFPTWSTCSGRSPSGSCSTVQSRDQRHVEVLAADPATGATTVVFEDSDDVWVELVPGVAGRAGRRPRRHDRRPRGRASPRRRRACP